MVHDAGRGGEDDVTELTRGQKLDNPLLEITKLDVVARVDDTGLVEAATIVSTCTTRSRVIMILTGR